MKNLKKTLAVVLAFAMVLSMGFSAFAYTDVTAGTKVAEAVSILSDLEIFEGFEDGTFKPNDTVTRAQMAAIICRTLGYEDQAAASTGSTNFNDVPASHWASGYINVAEALQVVNGYGNGNFGPEDQVTYEQAIKMIVVALGYELDAQAKGGWYTGYLSVAAREGITRNSNGVVGTPAARGTVAVLVYNSLEVRLMDQEVWTPIGQEDEFWRLDETILSRYLGIRKIEGVVSRTPITDYAYSYNADKEAKVTFAAGTEHFYYSNGIYTSSTYTGDKTYDCRLIPDMDSFSQKRVIAYVGREADAETGKLMIYAIAEKPGANTVTTISSTQLTTAGSAKAGYIQYKDVDGVKEELLLDDNQKWNLQYDSDGDIISYDTGVRAIGNFGKDGDDGYDIISSTADLANYVDSFGDTDQSATISLISNDTDSAIDIIVVTKYDNEATIKNVVTEDGVVMFDCYGGKAIDDIDVENEDVLNLVIKDGAVASVEDIAVGDTVSYLTTGNKNNVSLYYVSSKSVTGRVERYNSTNRTVTVGGETYKFSAASGLVAADFNGCEGIFYLNIDGQIAYAEAEDDGVYGIVLAAGSGSGLSSNYVLEVVLEDGTSGAYSLNDRVKYNGVYYDADVVVDTKLPTLSERLSNGSVRAQHQDIDNLVFKVAMRDEKIYKLEKLAVAGGAASKDYDAENMRYGGLYFDDATVVVSLETENATDVVKAKDVKVGKVADYFVDGGGDEYALTAYDLEDGIHGLVIGTGLTATISQKDAAFIVWDYSSTEVDGYDAFIVTGLQGGSEVSYTFSNAKSTSFYASDFRTGNILLPGVADADGIVYDAEILYSVADKTIYADADKEGEYYYAGDFIEQEVKNNRFFLANVDEVLDKLPVVGTTNTDHAYDAGNGITMMNSANYTLVDFSEGTSSEDAIISRKSKGAGLFSRYANDYDYEVFVRYFDEAMVDVVVYRYAQ